MSDLQAIPGDSRPPAAKPAAKPILAKKAPPAVPAAPILAPEAVRTARLDACLACDQLRENGYCAKGSFFVRIRGKLSSGSCPISKWPKGT
jgi:hypothetical protein